MIIGHYIPGSAVPGGITNYVRRLVDGQRSAGHQVHVLDRTGGGAALPEAKILHIDDELLAYAPELKLDVLHLHTVVAELSLPEIPIFRTMHGHWAYCPSGSRYLARPAVACDRAYSLFGCAWGHVVDRCGSVRPATFVNDFRRTWAEMRHARSVTTLAISGFVKDQMIRSGAPGDRIRVLHLPAPRVDPELSAKPLSLGPPRFVYAGRLNEQKGVHCLIRAMHEVEADVELDIAGDGPFEGAARRLCAELKIESRVKFHGWLAERQIHDLISAARAVVFPSVWHEPAGLVPLEAGALGRASISTRVGGIPEYAQRLGNSILVEPNSPAALSEAIRQVARDASLAQRLGEAGAVAARDYFSLDRHVAELAAVYRSRS